MTREEAIRIIETVFQDEYVYKYYDSITHQALNMAIEALRIEPVCEHFYKGYCNRFEDGCFRQCQAEPKHGKWEDRISCQVDEDAYDVANCSECKAEITIDPNYDNYCPNCGAKMDKELEE